ncbi:CMP-N-acetylneuraminate-beta-galactosamide-alpha-2,3-sialyltransferase 1-like [Archocentrus centrarchus]|uniref:CMP-N-acetylneuraminate-beta-galactosamide- alpha-2,3-sialyltransferase 1-like n=1 Tax=Archocentrus centrarchus TaxID=63155 RepID=UPI0011EA197E|nr:CMP-N-acetylneuraminate-beta-galactosamide-alpha-2,3-sialyltransferase 1-like [Archocentrus centrarchus]
MNQIPIQDSYGVKMHPRKPLVFLLLVCVTAIGVFSRASWILTVYHDYFVHQNASLCACDKCLTDYDPWFTKLIKESPEPFLSITNNVSSDAFNWWKRIQTDRRNYSYYKKTVDKVFQIFPTNVHSTRSSPDLCRTCAVIGNSGNLNGSHYGSMIDFHDIVIRMNHGPTEGFERDVGNKTTYHVMFPNSFKNLDNTTRLVFFPYKIRDLEWLMWSFTQSQRESAKSRMNKDLVMILSPEFMKYVHYVWLNQKGRYPSTGFLTLILSFHMCDEVSVFGFGADKNGNWNHYYEPLKNKRLKTGQHPGSVEYKYIEKLHEQKKISFFRGW